MRVNIRGIEFWVEAPLERDRAYWQLASRGGWEGHTFAALDRHVHGGTVYIDVGAWIGPTVLYAAARGAEVHAYEPDPVARQQLEANIDANPTLADRIRVYPVALGAERAQATIASPLRLGDSMASLVSSGETVAEEAPVEVVDGASEVTRPHWQQCGIVKIDIEGGEYALLPRVTPFLREFRPPLLLSTHPTRLGMRYWHLPRPMRVPLWVSTALLGQRVPWRLGFYRWHRPAGVDHWVPVNRTAALARPRDAEFLLAP